jgi:O-antigen/teichoic acid export membrane protein
LVLPAALAMVLAPPVLARLLPAYQPGLAALAWLAPGAVFLALALPATQCLVAVDRQRRALAVVLVAVALGAIANHVALSGGWGLVGVAAATAAAYVAYFVMAVAAALWAELNVRQRLRWTVVLAVVTVPTLCMAGAVQRCWPGARADVTVTLAKTSAVVAVWALSAGFAWHRGGWGRTLRDRGEKP